MTSSPCATRCSTTCGDNAPATRAFTSKMASPGTTGSAAPSSFAQSFDGSIISITWHTTVAPGTANSCSPLMSSGFTNWFCSPRPDAVGSGEERLDMTKRIFLAIATSLMLIAAGSVAAQDSDPKAEAQKEKKLAAGEREAKKMLLLMDTDKSGKVSQQEFM